MYDFYNKQFNWLDINKVDIIELWTYSIDF